MKYGRQVSTGTSRNSFAECLHRVQLAHDELRLRIDAGGGEQRLPVEPGHQLLELGARARVVGEVALAALGRRPVHPRDARLDLEDRPAPRRPGSARPIRVSMRAMCARYFSRIVRVHRVVLEVVVAVGQPEPALADDDGVAVRILLIDGDADAQRREQAQVRRAP